VDRARVLVVDDDPDFVEITRTVLQAHGYEIASASSGGQALEMMRRQRPDLVILDVMMRGATEGHDVSQVMYADNDLAKVPVLMVTSIMDGTMADQFPTRPGATGGAGSRPRREVIGGRECRHRDPARAHRRHPA